MNWNKVGALLMSAWEKINIAKRIIVNEFLDQILDFHLNEQRPMLTVIFRKGFVLYIQYNKFDEYAYHIQLVHMANNFIRYDNFDDHWEVITKPHHLHPGDKLPVEKSPMIGNPQIDMPNLIQILKELL